MKTLPATDGKLYSLQGLRALAVVLVLFAHASNQLAPGKSPWQVTGHFGVDIFFVISGFIMVFISSRRLVTWSSFLAERVLRIVPTYWFYTLLALAIYLVAPGAFRGTEASAGHVLLSMLFIAHENPVTGSTSPFLRLGWTLNYEMFFYLLFAIAIAISLRLRVWLTAAAIVLLVSGGALASQAGLRLPAPLAGLLILLGLAWALYTVRFENHDSLRGLVWGPAAALILLATPSLEGLARRPGLAWLNAIGDASYTIYLMHLFPLSFYRLVWQRLGLPDDTALAQGIFLATAIPGICLLGYLAYLFIEKPLVRGARRLAGRGSSPARQTS
ncbi:acyltransferase family protein [Pseudooceanicola sp. 200-1SW]|uniref:acyltransferase family protein n=1 Tax=Pseudooceanicola sp. 200-1SW TaxID=3425949 RepID=UPI003D7FBE2D